MFFINLMNILLYLKNNYTKKSNNDICKII